MHAFAGEIIERIACEPVREELDRLVWDRLEQKQDDGGMMANMADMAIDELAESFELLGDWESRFGYLIDLGKQLPPMDERPTSASA